MELDDLKNKWETIDSQTSTQNMLTSKIIDQMTQKKYNSSINKIKYPELIGGIVCFLGAIFIGFNFNKLDTLFFQSIAVLAILLLMILPMISFLSLKQFNLADNINKPYAETIKQFAIQKIRFIKYQKLNAFLNYLLLVTIIFLMPKFFFGKDITGTNHFWIVAFPIGFIFLLFFSKWIKHIYAKVLKQTEELLTEVES